MGLILAAAAGAGGQAADFADKAIVQDHALEREKYSSDLALERAKALEVVKLELGEASANRQRTEMTARVRGEAGRMAEERMAPKVAQEQAGIVNRAAWTPEQQAAVDQSNEIDRRGIVDRAVQDGSAAVRTGDIAPKDAMSATSRTEITQMKMDALLARAQDQTTTAKEIAEIRAQAVRDSAELRVRAAEQRAANGKIDRATGRMLITSEDANIKASTIQQQMLSREKENLPRQVGGKPNPRLGEIDEQMKSLNEEIATSKANKDAYLKDLGILPEDGARAHPKPKAAAPATPGAPAAAPASVPAGLPPGARQVGTSGGKPVYQLPDGSRVVGQ